MSRQYHERIEVQLGEPVQVQLLESAARASSCPVIPMAFIWRGRLHQVRTVVAQWTQRLPWWRTVWEDETEQQVLEHRVWRVEASAGIAAGTGVYDLAQGQHWQLIRVAD